MTALITSIMIMLGFVHSSAPAPQQATATPAPATRTFHSADGHFDYTYPANLAVDDKIMTDALKGEKDKAEGDVKKAAIGCITTPLTAMDESNGFQMVVVIRLDGTCLGADLTGDTLPALITPMMTESLTRIGTPTVGKSANYTVSGNSAIALSGTAAVKDSDTIVYGAVTCLSTGKDALCWEFLSDKCATVSSLAAYPIKFEGKEPEALIPATLLPCK